MYNYKARIIKVYDGDTYTFQVDLGFHIQVTEKIRLLGVDTPELRGDSKEFGKEVRDFVRGLILNKDCEITVYKQGKYGRYIAKVMFPAETKHTLEYKDLGEELLKRKYAVRLNYK